MPITNPLRPGSGRRRRRRLMGPVTLLAALATVVGLVAVRAAPVSAAPARGAARPAGHIASAPRSPARLKPVVRAAVRHDTSPPLRSLRPLRVRPGKRVTTVPLPPVPYRVGAARTTGRARTADVQRTAAVTGSSMPGFGQTFEGVGNLDNVLPPDTNGAVGPNDYVQTVNTHFAAYSKQGALLYGPASLGTLWQGFGGQCDPSVDPAANGGDPIVVYDETADRWVISQLAYPQLRLGTGGYHECVAVSATPDPTGAYYRYDFLFSQDTLNDYPKLGVWPDAYYMSDNGFLNDQTFTGVTVTAFDRAKMLAGQPASMVRFTIGTQYASLLPSNAEGGAVGQDPSAGAPNPFFMSCDAANGGPCASDQLDEWDFHVDWASPAASTFGTNGAPTTTIPVAAFDSSLCSSDDCIPQPGTSQDLEVLSDRLMYQAAYRNLGGGTQAVVLNQTVNVSANPATSPQAGVRWYELANTGAGWALSQQGTYAPDSDNRWMGSVNIDASGDLAVGYSVSSATTFPAIRVAGRLASDPAGQLSQGEETLMAGGGSQTSGFARWGDYSAMQADPTNGCTFWYTSEYLPTTSDSGWHTRIGSFTFPTCTAPPHGAITGTVIDATTGNPLPAATITTSAGATTVTDAQGHYTLPLPPGTYNVTATGPFGYGSKTVTGVTVTAGATTTADFTLTPLPTTTVSGTVTDGSGHGWPLYAKITIDGYPGGPIYTSPFTGHYSVKLAQQTTFTMHVAPVYEPGYLPYTTQFSTGTASTVTQNAALGADLTACQAPGYGFNGLSQDFTGWTGTTPHDGWAVQSSTTHGWQFDNPGNRPPPPGGDSGFAIADSNFYGRTRMNTALLSPVINLSGQTAPRIQFDTAYYAKPKGETASVDLSLDGGSIWTTIWHQTTANATGQVDLPIPQAANDTAVRVRFHYTASNAWWWAVDNVFVGTHTCVPISGGQVEGQASDTTSQPLVGAIITSNDRPTEYAVSVQNPDDPALPSGFYWLFSSLTGPHPFTATDTGHNSATATVNVAPNQLTRQDWALTPTG